jgi:hypothetical protein
MFASIGNIALIPPSLNLVATALPNSIALRVPYYNIAPSVSSAKLDNNASNNNTAALKTNHLQLSALENNAATKFSLNINSNSISFTANAQTTFLTQLASGDISPETNGIFLQYEKLLSYADVKYKPSNAGKPAAPTNLFKTLLQQEKVGGVELPAPPPANEAAQAPVVAEYKAEPRTEPQPVKEVSLPQLLAYSATIIRNHDIAPTELESA